jgi:SAM-dependent methyltransferase
VTDPQRGRARWAQRYADDAADDRPPSPWVMNACLRIPDTCTIVDIAAGTGRHAGALSRTGRNVIAVEFVEIAIRHATHRNRPLAGVVADAWSLPFAHGSLDAILVTNFLERDLFEELKMLLRPGAHIVYETYTMEHLRLVEAGRARAPRSEAYLLQPGELTRLLAPFEILDAREGHIRDEAGERYCASAVARKAQAPGQRAGSTGKELGSSVPAQPVPPHP